MAKTVSEGCSDRLGHKASLPDRQHGFTLLESVLSLVIVALLASIVGTVYVSGLQIYNVESDTLQVSSALRSRMEQLLSTEFSQLASGSQVLTINGTSYTATWTVSTVDMTGDGIAESTAKSVSLTLGGSTLVTLVANSTDKVFKW